MDEFIDALKQNLVVNNILFEDDKMESALEELTTLKLDCNTPIFYFDFLKAVKSISISNYIISDREPDINMDYACINNFTSLESLIITHNKNIKFLDASNLENLKTIVLVGNKNLTNIFGLDKLKKLNTIIIVGNDIRDFDNPQEFFDNNKNCETMKLDISFYHFLIETKIDLKKYNVTFAEKVSVGELYNMNIDMMNELYSKGLQILSIIIKGKMTDREKARLIYTYIVKKLRYDYDNLAKRNDYIYSHNIGINDNKFKDINTSYKALKDYKVVCEGYANLYRFLLNLEGIDAETVNCFVKDKNLDFEFYNHSANKIKIENEWYYCDSQLETDYKNLKYFLKTKEEFEITHIIPNERRIK